jgi:hypothetical protein
LFARSDFALLKWNSNNGKYVTKIHNLFNDNSVLACNRYESTIEIMKIVRKFDLKGSMKRKLVSEIMSIILDQHFKDASEFNHEEISIWINNELESFITVGYHLSPDTFKTTHLFKCLF